MAGTDLAHQRHFEEQAEIYRQAFTEQIDQWDLQARRGVVSAEDRYGGESVWMSVKPFEYRSPALGFALEQALLDVLTMLGWLVLAVALLARTARRVEP